MVEMTPRGDKKLVGLKVHDLLGLLGIVATNLQVRIHLVH